MTGRDIALLILGWVSGAVAQRWFTKRKEPQVKTETKTYVVPQLNIGGTSKEELLAQHRTVTDWLTGALTSALLAAPHPRDYPDGGDIYVQAQAQHEDRQRRIIALIEEYKAIRAGITIQGRDK